MKKIIEYCFDKVIAYKLFDLTEKDIFNPIKQFSQEIQFTHKAGDLGISPKFYSNIISTQEDKLKLGYIQDNAGEPLEKLVSQDRLTKSDLYRIGFQTGQHISVSRSNGILYADLHAENILVERHHYHDTVKLIDWEYALPVSPLEPLSDKQKDKNANMVGVKCGKYKAFPTWVKDAFDEGYYKALGY